MDALSFISQNNEKNKVQIGMAIFTRSAGTRSGPTLMGRVLPGPIKNRIGYGFKKKTRNGSGSGPGFIKKTQTRPETRPV